MLGVAIYGVTLLETKFEAEWFLPPDSYLTKWFDASKQYFPSDGVKVYKDTFARSISQRNNCSETHLDVILEIGTFRFRFQPKFRFEPKPKVTLFTNRNFG